MNRLKLDQILWKLRQQDFFAEGRDIRYGLNKVRWHNEHESPSHYLTKSLLSLLIMKQRDVVITEPDLRTGESPDVLQIKQTEEKVFYEIESERKDVNKSYLPIVIYLDDMPKEVKVAIPIFVNWVKGYVV